MTEPRTPSSVVSGAPEPVDAVCTRCRREGIFSVGLYVLTPDGPVRTGERVFCVCETHPAFRATITNGDARRTGDTCDRCRRMSMYEVPFFAMSSAGVAPHSVKIICRDCDTRPKR